MPNDPQQVPSSDEELPVFTASACQLAGSAWVLQLIFADVQVPRAGQTTATEVPRMVIGLPWSLAKVVHRILGAAIEQYEKREGTISVPKSVQSQLDKQVVELTK